MSFSYNLGANPTIDFIRAMIGDTQPSPHVFEDEEIGIFWSIQGNTAQSSMFLSPPVTRTVPTTPVSYLRVAALALDAIAASRSRLAVFQQIGDIKVSPDKAADALRKSAVQMRTIDDESAAFFIAEQCGTQWSFIQRYWNQAQRETGGGS